MFFRHFHSNPMPIINYFQKESLSMNFPAHIFDSDGLEVLVHPPCLVLGGKFSILRLVFFTALGSGCPSVAGLVQRVISSCSKVWHYVTGEPVEGEGFWPRAALEGRTFSSWHGSCLC